MKSIQSILTGDYLRRSLFLLMCCCFLGITSFTSSVEDSVLHLSLIVEFEKDRQLIYITEQNKPPRQIVILTPLGKVSQLAQKNRMNQMEKYKEEGYEIWNDKLIGPYDHTQIFRLLTEIEDNGWTLADQNFTMGGAGADRDFKYRSATQYFFIKES